MQMDVQKAPYRKIKNRNSKGLHVGPAISVPVKVPTFHSVGGTISKYASIQCICDELSESQEMVFECQKQANGK